MPGGGRCGGDAARVTNHHHLPGWQSKGSGGERDEGRHIGGSIAGCVTAALLHRAGHDVIVFERSESDLVSRGAGIQAVYSVAPRSYAGDRLCLAGDAGAVFPPFTGSGVLKAMTNATSLADALASAPAVDDALRRWGEAQVQFTAQLMPVAERIERSAVFDMPDLTAMPTTATNDWMSAAHPGLVVTLPDV